MTFRRLLQDSLTIAWKTHPEKIVAIDDDRAYTYADLFKESQNIARHLRKHGFQRGDRGAIFIENSWNILTSIYGVLYAGGTFLVINHLTKQDKLAYMLKDCEASFLLSDSMVSRHFVPAVAGNSHLKEIIYAGEIIESFGPIPLTRFDDVHSNLEGESPELSCESINLDLAALIYTSGSTGDPKGVMMTHQSMVFTSDSLVEYLRLDADARIMCFLPFAFDYGLYQILMTVRLGASLIIGKSFAFPGQIFELLRESQATVFPGVPTVYSTLINMYQKAPFSFPFVDRVTNTAAALPMDYISTLKKIFPNALIFKMYGLTECKRVCYLEPELIDTHAGSVGKAIPGTEVMLLDTNMNPVAAHQDGILYVRGAHVMRGYWNKPGQSRDMLVTGILPGEEVLCTHDRFSRDEDGFLYFKGRTDDIIKARGEKVSPVEVENALYSISGVREAAVIGVPDPVEGEFIKAFVSLDPGSDLQPRQLRQHCIAKLENFMVPREVVILDELPKTDSNKISKKELK
jgi:acyl-CoA synthetase (AMP-forming)/AMP-acid ligase II